MPDVAKPVTKVIDDAGKTIGQVGTNVVKETGIGLGNVAREGGIALNNVATTIHKAGSDTGAQLNRSQHDLEDAGTAIHRFTLNELKGTQASLSHAEQRFRDGKIVDALFHLSTEPLQNTEQNAATAAQESQLLATVGSVAASVYGGPTGAAAYAAWLTYHQTGDINMALRVGVIAGLSSYANGQASTMAKTTVTDTMNVLLSSVPLGEPPWQRQEELPTPLIRRSCVEVHQSLSRMAIKPIRTGISRKSSDPRPSRQDAWPLPSRAAPMAVPAQSRI